MYEIIPENERIYYSEEELDKNFDGKWLFLVDSELDEFRRLVRAKVAVVADRRWGGYGEGIYKRIYGGSEWDLLDEDDWGEDWE